MFLPILAYFTLPHWIKGKVLCTLEYRGILKSADISKYERILFVIAHPDDLEFLCGGTVHKFAESGKRVFLAVFTTGGWEKYMPAFLSKYIVNKRRVEQLRAAEIAGIEEVIFFDHPDGNLNDDKKVVSQMEGLLNTLKPDAIFTFDPHSWLKFCHPDHKAVGKAVIKALQNGKLRNSDLYLFSTRKPNLIIDITDTFPRKWKTLQVYSNFRLISPIIRTLQEGIAGGYGALIEVKYGEGYRKIENI